mgnify:FL=1
MPNWVNNNIAIILPEERGSQAQSQLRWDILRDLKTHLDTSPEQEEGSLSILHPVPPELDDNDAYRWRCNNWGTKWDVETNHYRYTHNHVVISGSTAWSAPTGVIEHLLSLGFVVEIQHHSCENFEWGSSDGDGGDMYYADIDEDDEDDETANELWEYENSLDDGEFISFEECIEYFMYGEMAVGRAYDPRFTVLDSGWMDDMFEYDADRLYDAYQTWKDNHHSPVTNTEFKLLREWMLNKIESSQTNGQYNEGEYLELMNSLKNATLSDLRELWEEHNKKFEMSQYYSGENREPNLIRIYG